MATSSKNNVSLVIEAGVTGEAEIRRFADEVRRLAKEGSDAAPEFQALAAQLDTFAQQGGAIAAVRELTAQFEALTAEQAQARAAADATGAAFLEQKTKADALRASQQGLKDDIGAAKVEVVQAENAVREYTKQFDAAGKKTAEYRSRSEELQATLSLARLQLIEKKVALDQLTPALTKAAAEERKLGVQFEALNASAERSAAALRQRAVALNEADAAAQAVGVGTTDLVAAENALLASTQRVAAETARLAQEQRDAAGAASALADLDRQNAAALEQQQARLFAIVEAYEKEQAALVAATAAAKAKRQADYEAIEAASAKAAATRLAAEAEARAAAETKQLAAEAEQADADFKALEASMRATAAAAEKIAAAESAAAMRTLEEAARQADAEFRDLTASLRGAETAAQEFAATTERAAAAGQDDVDATRARVRAAEQLIDSERRLDAAQSELAASRNAGRAALLQEAQSLLAAARAADQSAEATARLVAQATRAEAALQGAFGQTGVRSLQAIEAEVVTVERSVTLLQQRFAQGAISAADLSRALSSAQVRLATLNAEARNIPALPTEIDKIAGSVNAAINKFAGLGAALATVGAAVTPVVQATIALDQMRRVLTTVTGSAESAELQIAFLRKTAQDSGQSFTELGASYAKFAASALQSGLSLTDTQAVFKSVALAAGNLGLSSDHAKRALEALSQIASKGTVSLEELRQQLGDALPGVLPLLAKELGLTQAELNKVVESGQLLASEAIPAIGRALTALQPASGTVNGIVATFNRFKNVVLEAGTAIIEGPLGQGAGVLLTSLAGVIRDLAFVAVSASSGIQFLGQSIGATAAFIAGGAKDFDNYRQTISTFAEQAGQRIEQFKATAYGANDGAKALGVGVAALGESFAKLALEQQKAVDAADINARSLELLAQAQQKASQGTQALIALSGDEQKALDVAAASQRAYADALEAQAAADEAALAARRAFKEALIDEALRRGQALDSIKASVEALDKEIRVKDASAVKSREQADAMRGVATAAEIQALAFKDNASRYEEFAAGLEGATNALEGVRRAFLRGKATTDDVRAADEALAVAKAKLRDAIDDQLSRAERLINGLKAEADFTKALLELDIARLKVKQQEALTRGADTEARLLGVKIAELELEVTKTGTAAKRAEANELIRTLTLRREELRVAGQLTPELEADLNVRIRRAQIQTLEADTTEVSTEAEQKHLQAVKNGTEELGRNTASVGTSTAAVESNTAARTKNAEATGKQSDAQKRYNDLLRDDPSRLVGGNGLGGINGKAGSADMPGVRSPGGQENKLAADGGSDLSVLGPTGSSTFTGNAQIPVPEGYAYTLDPYAPGAISAGYAPNGQLYGGYFVPLPGTGGLAPAPAPAPSNADAGRGAQVITVKLDFGGKVYPVQADEDTATALVRALQRAQSAAGG